MWRYDLETGSLTYILSHGDNVPGEYSGNFDASHVRLEEFDVSLSVHETAYWTRMAPPHRSTICHQ